MQRVLLEKWKFHNDGDEFSHQDCQIEHHAHGDLPQQGVHLPKDNRMPEAQRLTEIE